MVKNIKAELKAKRIKGVKNIYRKFSEFFIDN
jgi:hypothetical protein